MKKLNEMVVVPTAELLSEMEALEIVGGSGINNPDDSYKNCGCTNNFCTCPTYSSEDCNIVVQYKDTSCSKSI